MKTWTKSAKNPISHTTYTIHYMHACKHIFDNRHTGGTDSITPYAGGGSNKTTGRESGGLILCLGTGQSQIHTI